MGPRFLPPSDGADGPGIKCLPNGAEDLVYIGYAIGVGPPRGIPWNAVVLVDDQVKRRLLSVPLNSLKHRGAHTTPSHDSDAVDGFLRFRAREIVRKPKS